MANRPIRESSPRRAWIEFKPVISNPFVVLASAASAASIGLVTEIATPSDQWDTNVGLVLDAAVGVGTLTFIAVSIYAGLWFRSPYRQRDEARDAAELRTTRLQVAKQVFFDIASEGERVIAEYQLDAAFEPSLKRREEWYGEGCRALEELLNPYEARQQRNRHMLNEGLEFGNWATVMLGLAGFLAARARQIDESDLSPRFHIEDWENYSIKSAYSDNLTAN